MLRIFPAIHPKSFNQFSLLFTEKLHSCVKSEFYQNGQLETNFKYVAIITMLRGTIHACMFFNSSINSMREVNG